MKLFSRNSTLVGISVLATALTVGAVGRAQTRDDGAAAAGALNRSTTGAISVQENDRRINRWLAVDNRMIMECAKMAKGRATNTEVSAFAEALVTGHQKFIDAGGLAKGSVTERSDSASTRVEVRKPVEGDARLTQQPTDFLEVHEAVCNRLRDVAKKEWATVTGPEFDCAFMKHQVMAHEALIAAMQSVRPTASPELQPALDRGIETMTTHLTQARKLCDQITQAKGNR